MQLFLNTIFSDRLLDKELFDAVQQRLKQHTVERSNQRRASPSLLMGKIFDDRGNPMSPKHANKKGVRYRYYVSQALLQGRKKEAGSVARVSAPDVESLVLDALRQQTRATESAGCSDRDLVECRLARVVVRRAELAIELLSAAVAVAETDPQGAATVTTITIPFTPTLAPRKGVAHSPAAAQSMDEASRIALLGVIGRARAWNDEIGTDASVDLETIAAREGLGAAYIRRLAALAYLSPRLIEAIADGRAPADLTATKLLTDLPLSWAEQEQRFPSA